MTRIKRATKADMTAIKEILTLAPSADDEDVVEFVKHEHGRLVRPITVRWARGKMIEPEPEPEPYAARLDVLERRFADLCRRLGEDA